jgi:diaminohydroxyphosphoribosylaminopyrimidine deaminase/5-amino-6-(5-phosphoribosylamino)uracil reductase
MPLAPIDRALQLARSALGTTSPNPSVGCVLTGAAGQTLGEGHTQRAGGPHAEIIALRDAAAKGHDVRGATAWVTLEPCSHHGRTGPCCDALVAAGIRRVVASLADPNPLVAGQGFGRLRAAGIEVEVGAGADEARELNIGFFSRMERQLPWVRLKAAASLDGRTALDNGQSQWITSKAARVDGHAWRARACAILTGVGTVLQDNPRLDVRHVQTPRQPRLVIVDSQLNTPPDAELFSPSREVWIYTACPDAARQAALASRGAVVIPCPVRAAKWTWPPCCKTLPGVRSTNCTWKQATNSTDRCFARGWSMSFCSTSPPGSWAMAPASPNWAHTPACQRHRHWIFIHMNV